MSSVRLKRLPFLLLRLCLLLCLSAAAGLALRADTTVLRPLDELAQEHAAQLVRQAYDQERRYQDFAAALVSYQQAIAIDPGYADAYYGRAVIRAKLGEEYQADYQLAQRIDPDPYKRLYYESRLLFYQDRLEEALDSVDQALELRQDLAEPYYHRGLIYIQLQLPQSASDSLSQAIALDRTHDMAYSRLGSIYSSLHRYRSAIARYTSAITIRPAAVTYINRANMEAILGLNDDAQRDYLEALRLEPELAKATCNLINFYRTINQQSRREKVIEQGFALGRDEACLYAERGIMYGEDKMYQVAIDDLNHCLELEPANARCYAMRAWARSGLGLHEQAVIDYTEQA